MLTELVSLIPNGPMRLVHIWMLVTSATFVSIIASSGLVFYLLYWPSNVTYNKWRYKVRFLSQCVQRGMFTMTYRRMEILLSPTLDHFLMSTMEKALIKLLAWKLSYRFHNNILFAPTN